ncbi:AAA family ATPase [Metabacillus sp. JX24]|uniref:AAA family ATPase n=1 Tax=Metabacillus sp. JX24 TaxID=3240759 RepID=UPI0035104233
MKKILSIQGGMAGGKTTLAKRLEKLMQDVFFLYENPYPNLERRNGMNLDISTREGFVENQRIFIASEINRFNNLPDGKIIFDRGPEDIEFYTLHYPLANEYVWDVENELQNELQELRECRSDYILYLDANEETLRSRKQNDKTRGRSTFEQSLKIYSFEKEWFKQFNTRVVDVNHLTPHQLEKFTMKFLKEIHF